MLVVSGASEDKAPPCFSSQALSKGSGDSLDLRVERSRGQADGIGLPAARSTGAKI